MQTRRGSHLAVFLPGLYEGGAERSTLNLAEGLAMRGYAVDLVLAEAVGPYLAQVPEAVRLVVLNTRRRVRARTLGCLPALASYLRREQPAALLSSLNFANVVALWARRLAGVPERMLIVEQNTLSVELAALSRVRRRILLGLVRACYPWATGVIAVSTGVAHDLVPLLRIPQPRIHVVYNPVVTPALHQKASEAPAHPWFDPGQPPVMLAVGRLTAQKDFPTLLRAFAHVRAECEARLIILGEGEEREALQSLVRKLGLEEAVSLPGFVANPYAFMARSRLFILSSRWEGLPTVLIEALACGVPVVATDCPNGPREILQEGRFGQLVPMGNAEALAQAIGQALADGGRRPPRESWLPYDRETVLDQYVELLCGGGPCAG
jgi:glycosyltransferase involved in cell wall biosynthesis